ncbi:MAG: GDSL-type esterase/lipase family protein [Mangrovibacterium sp.]
MKKFLKFILLIGILLLNDGLSAQSIDKLYPSKSVVSRYHNDWTIKNYQSRIASFKNKPLKYGEVVFIGNSITQQGGDWNKRFGLEHIRNRGIAGDVTDGILKRLDEICYFQPKAVFILIGVNDLFNMHHDIDTRFAYDKIVPSVDYIAKNILRITKKIARKSPQTKIYVRTILPTRRDFLKDDIIAVNKLIRSNAVNAPYEVIDLYNQFINQKGSMVKEYTKDGVHLTQKGYEHWVEFERPILDKILNSSDCR